MGSHAHLVESVLGIAVRRDPVLRRARELNVPAGAPKATPGVQAGIRRWLGHEDVPGPKPGKHPLGNRLYHLASVVTGLLVVGTGVFMMSRVRTPIFTRNPYLFSDSTWGLTYVGHGL